MNDPALATDLIVALSALVGLIALRWHLGPARDGLAARFRVILGVAILFYGARAAHWLTEAWMFRTLAIAGAVALPLGALLLAEGLMRRHAPVWVKAAIAGGAAILTLLAAFGLGTQSAPFLWALMGFQIGAFSLIAALILLRHRDMLTRTENERIDRVALSFLAILPFLLSDYGLLLPVRVSGLAALIVCLLIVKLEDRSETALRLGLGTVATLGAAGGIGWAGAAITQTGGLAGLRIAAIAAAILLLLRVGLTIQQVRAGRARRSIAAALQSGADLQTYLNGVRRSGLTDGFAILGPSDLHGFDAASVRTALEPQASATRADLPADPATDTMGQSQLRLLLDRHGATRIYLVAHEPLTLAVGQAAGLSTARDADLDAAFAFARLIGQTSRPEPSPCP